MKKTEVQSKKYVVCMFISVKITLAVITMVSVSSVGGQA